MTLAVRDGNDRLFTKIVNRVSAISILFNRLISQMTFLQRLLGELRFAAPCEATPFRIRDTGIGGDLVEPGLFGHERRRKVFTMF